MNRNSRPGDLEFKEVLARSKSRTSSSYDQPISANNSLYSINPLLDVLPEPAFVAPAAATGIVTANHGSLLYEEGLVDCGITTIPVALPALRLVNQFLDFLLYSFLSAAKSTSLSALRPAVSQVLKARFSKEAIAGADEELQSYLGGSDDEGIDGYQNDSAEVGEWDLQRAWKRSRIRCMVYSSLGDLEEDDEAAYAEFDLEGSVGSQQCDSNSLMTGVVTPAVAIWLTAILEFVAEQTLLIAGLATVSRFSTSRSNALTNGAINTSDRPIVEELDMEKVALNPSLGRMWRQWRKLLRVQNSTITSPLERRLSHRGSWNYNLRDEGREFIMTSSPTTKEEDPGTHKHRDLNSSEEGGEEKKEEGALQTLSPGAKTVAMSPLTPIAETFPYSEEEKTVANEDHGEDEKSWFFVLGNQRRQRSLSMPNILSSIASLFEVVKETQKRRPQSLPPLESRKRHFSLPSTPYSGEQESQDMDDFDWEHPSVESGSAISFTSSSCQPRLVKVSELRGRQPSNATKGSRTESPAVAAATETSSLMVQSSTESAPQDTPNGQLDSTPPSTETQKRSPDGLRNTPSTRSLIPRQVLAHSMGRKGIKAPLEIAVEGCELMQDGISSTRLGRSSVGECQDELAVGDVPAADGLCDDSAIPQIAERHRQGHVEAAVVRPYTNRVPPSPKPLSPVTPNSPPYSHTSSCSSTVISRRHQPIQIPSYEQSSLRAYTPPGSPGNQKTRRSESFSKASRPIHTSHSSASSSSQKVKSFITWPGENGKRMHDSDDSSSVRSEKLANRLAKMDDKEKSFEELIQSGGTIHFTITPDPIRELESPEGPFHHSEIAETSSVRIGSSRKVVTTVTAVTVPSTPKTPKFPPTASPRDARIDDASSARDLALFLRSTGPPDSPDIKGSVPKTTKLLGTPASSPQFVNTPASPITQPLMPALQKSDSKATNPNKKKWIAREPTAATGDSTSALADFFRNTTPPVDGEQVVQRRIPKTVAPFRTTIDSIQFDNYRDSSQAEGELTGSPAPELSLISSNPPDSYQSSMRSSVGLLRSQTKRNEEFLRSNLQRSSSTAAAQNRMAMIDPSALDIEDEIDLEDLKELDLILPPPNPRPRRDESLTDFLNNVPPPPPTQVQPFILSSENQKRPEKKNSAVSFITRLGGRAPSRKNSLVAAVENPAILVAPHRPIVISNITNATTFQRSSSSAGQPSQNRAEESNISQLSRAGTLNSVKTVATTATASTRPNGHKQIYQARQARVMRDEATDSLAEFFKYTPPPPASGGLKVEPLVTTVDVGATKGKKDDGLTKIKNIALMRKSKRKTEAGVVF